MATITVEVPDDLARQYQIASVEQRRKLDALISIQTGRLLSRPVRDIDEVMNELPSQANRNGLTLLIEPIFTHPDLPR